jgi:hypothetical protein
MSGWSGVAPWARYLLILRTVSVRLSRSVPTRRLSVIKVPSIMTISFPAPSAMAQSLGTATDKLAHPKRGV